MSTIHVEERAQANLLSLILETVLAQAQDSGRQLPTKGRIGVSAGPMGATLAFSPQGTAIFSGVRAPVDARLTAPLPALAALGRGKFGTAIKGGKIRFSGSMPLLLRLAVVLRPAEMRMPLGPSCPVRARWVRAFMKVYAKARYRNAREVK